MPALLHVLVNGLMEHSAYVSGSLGANTFCSKLVCCKV